MFFVKSFDGTLLSSEYIVKIKPHVEKKYPSGANELWIGKVLAMTVDNEYHEVAETDVFRDKKQAKSEAELFSISVAEFISDGVKTEIKREGV